MRDAGPPDRIASDSNGGIVRDCVGAPLDPYFAVWKMSFPVR